MGAQDCIQYAIGRMMNRLIDIITTDDNTTLEFAYIVGLLFAFVGLGLEIYSVIYGKTFDFQAYGIGSGTLIAGAAGGKWIGRPLGAK
jgi:hypothetical protein